MSNRLADWALRWGVPAVALDELFTMDNLDGDASGGSESSVVRECRLIADASGGFLWRNNSGATFDARKRMIRYGLGNDSKKLNRDYKSSDLIGIGCDGRFLAVECKTPGWRTPSNAREIAQANFISHVRKLGGRAAFVTNAASVAALVRG
jgi:hypothetical protein